MDSSRETLIDGFAPSYRLDFLTEGKGDLTEEIPGFIKSGERFEMRPDSANPDWTLVVTAEPEIHPSTALASASRQSWSWPEGVAVAAAATHAITLRDLRPGSIAPRARIEAINTAVAAILDLLPVAAIHWIPTEQVVDPDGFRRAFEIEGSRTAFGAINVRMFRIDQYEDGSAIDEPETIMDTLGLAALGLEDFQLHFRDLEPALAGDFLYRLALTSWNENLRIAPGHPVEGIDGARWSIELEEAIVPPERPVLDLRTHETDLAGR